MNKSDKKNVESIAERLNAMTGQLEAMESTLEGLYEEASQLADAEREKYDNLPDSIRDGERGEAIDTAANNLETLRDQIESAKDSVDSVKSAIDEASSAANDVTSA